MEMNQANSRGLLGLIMNSSGHMGHMRRFRNGASAGFVIATRNGIDIVDPRLTLRSIVAARELFSRLTGKPLAIFDRTDTARDAGRLLPVQGSLCGRWKPGSLTNLRHGPLGEPPAALFISSLRRNRIAATEARSLGIPVVGICDTDADPGLADIPIPCNDDNQALTILIWDVVSGRTPMP